MGLHVVVSVARGSLLPQVWVDNHCLSGALSHSNTQAQRVFMGIFCQVSWFMSLKEERGLQEPALRNEKLLWRGFRLSVELVQ